MDFKGDVMMLKIFLNLVTIDVVDIEIRHGEHSAPSFVARRKLAVFWIEDTV